MQKFLILFKYRTNFITNLIVHFYKFKKQKILLFLNIIYIHFEHKIFIMKKKILFFINNIFLNNTTYLLRLLKVIVSEF